MNKKKYWHHYFYIHNKFMKFIDISFNIYNKSNNNIYNKFTITINIYNKFNNVLILVLIDLIKH